MRWVVTGVAGFIGSSLLEKLLLLDQSVTGVDNFATGYRHNLDDVRSVVGEARWRRFRFVEGSIDDLLICREATRDADVVLHQAALGSVPRSFAQPLQTHEANLTGFLNVLVAASEAGVRRFVYASSSSVYGDHPGLPKRENAIGKPLSPYAVTKVANELYARVFAAQYGIEVIGLRYFNVFGPRQDPSGEYAAVIPRWISQRLDGVTPRIYGDGETSRDFCYIANTVQANLLAATTMDAAAVNQVYNIAVGEATTLNTLLATIDGLLRARLPALAESMGTPEYQEFRAGDVRHSLADIGKASSLLGYTPAHRLTDGLRETVDWRLAASSGALAATNVGALAGRRDT